MTTDRTPSISQSQLFTALFALLASSLVFWTVSAGLSSYLGRPEKMKEAAKSAEPPAVPEVLKGLEAEVKADSNNPEKLLKFAEALAAEGEKAGDAGLLMRAIQNFSQVLAVDPKNPRALFGVANVSFESGVFDKAKEYYERYVAVDPNNLKAKTDLALVHLQLGETKEAVSRLEKLSEENPKYFPAKLSLALAKKVSGDLPAARKIAEDALELAPDNTGKEVVNSFLAGLDKPENTQAASTPEVSPESMSPAMLVDQFFRNHPIVGPKIEQIRWVSTEVVEIRLNDFPMSQMPPFAKEKFFSNLKKAFEPLKDPLTTRFVDSASGNVMEEIKSK